MKISVCNTQPNLCGYAFSGDVRGVGDEELEIRRGSLLTNIISFLAIHDSSPGFQWEGTWVMIGEGVAKNL